MKNNIFNLEKYAQEKYTLKDFVKLVDKIVASKIGITTEDLPDYNFFEYFDEGMSEEEMQESARECAYGVIEGAGADQELLESLFDEKEEKEEPQSDEKRTEEFFDKYIY